MYSRYIIMALLLLLLLLSLLLHSTIDRGITIFFYMTARWYTVQNLNRKLFRFGVVVKKLMIHVLEDHEKEIEPFIKEALKKCSFLGGWYILRTWHKTKFVEMNSNSVGGFSLHRQSDLLNRQHYTYEQWNNRLFDEAPTTRRTWGQIFRCTARYIQRHAITLNQLSMVIVSFKTSVDGDKKEISKEIGFHVFNLKKCREELQIL